MQRLCEGLGCVRTGLIENLDEGDPEVYYFKMRRAFELRAFLRRQRPFGIWIHASANPSTNGSGHALDWPPGQHEQAPAGLAPAAAMRANRTVDFGVTRQRASQIAQRPAPIS
jgi:hypothetical protein